ncbi:hypothetical protein [Nostoc sp.]|uniref:hypothetical protein n=1 Tax=Nostoc sp. TaxID=1180 RepID=UPI002FEF8507
MIYRIFSYLKFSSKNLNQTVLVAIAFVVSANSSRLIPLYCLYSNWNNSPQFTSRYANYYPVEESYGCSILSVFAVRYLQSKKRNPPNFKVLRPYMTPWDGLVCCYGDRAADLPHKVLENWKKFIRPIEIDILDGLDETIYHELDGKLNHYRRIYDDIQLIDKPPEHVQLLLKNKLVDQPDPNLRSLTVFQERDEPIEIDW